MLKAIISCLFFVFFLCQKGQAQTEFMPIGAKVYGNTFTIFASDGNFTTTSEKDTFCGSLSCRKIVTIDKRTLPSESYRSVNYSRQVKDSVFFLDDYTQKFELVYKTDMLIGDSINYKFYSSCCGWPAKATLFADSIKMINSMQITRCHLNCPSDIFGRPGYRLDLLIYNRFGTGYGVNPAYFCDFGFSDDTRYYPVCYKDQQIFFTTSRFSGSNCGLTTSSNEIEDRDISISPNPFQNYLDISCNENVLIRKCTLLDALGHTLQEKEFEDVKTAHWILNNHANGVYLLKIQTSLGYSTVKKIIVSQ